MTQAIVPPELSAAYVIAVRPERILLQLSDGRPRDIVRPSGVSEEAIRFEFALGSWHVVHEKTPFTGYYLVDFS